MRRPNPRMANNGTGRCLVTLYDAATDPDANADEEGNWVKTPTVKRTYLATVVPSFATGQDGNGTDLSITTYSVLFHCYRDPRVKPQDEVGWFEDTGCDPGGFGTYEGCEDAGGTYAGGT